MLREVPIDSGDVQMLADLIKRGKLPSLQHVGLGSHPVGGGAVVQLMESFKVANLSLTHLGLARTGLNDEDLAAFAAASEGGGMRGSLKYVDMLGNVEITDVGAMRLSVAIEEGYLKESESLELGQSSIQAEGASALVNALLMQCPKLKRVSFPSGIAEPARLAMKEIVGNKFKILFF